MKLSVVVFDIGNVVLDFDFSILLGKVARRSERTTQEIVRWFGQSELEREFETGRITPEEFFARVAEILPVGTDYHDFVAQWNHIFSETPGTAGILEDLKGSMKIIAATNTNALHLAHIREHYPILEVFEALVASCEIGHRKPHAAFYQELLRVADAPPQSVLFIDDLERNVQAAVRTGMRGILFRGATELRRRLKALEVLP